MKRSFVPRPSGVREAHPCQGWSSSLLRWTTGQWSITSSKWSAQDRNQRQALVNLGRRRTRRGSRPVLRADPGRVVTARPTGTRMGKGKGKAHTTRRWYPVGAIWSELTCFGNDRPSGLGILQGRSSNKLVLHRGGY